jgi:Predicted membrane protein essB.
MMKKNVELLNIEVGTFRRVGKNYQLSLIVTNSVTTAVSELNELKKTTADFLPLVNIAEQEKQIELTYQLPSELQSLKNVGSENKAIKTAVAKAIMEQDILSKTSYHVSLNPANIWYYPMSHIVYAYRANELMPFYETHSPLDQYKALVLYCLTGAPYELLLDNPKETLNKLNDELIQQIQAVNSVQELKQVVAQIEDYVTYQQWQTVDKNKVKTKRSYLATLATVVIIAVIAVVGQKTTVTNTTP